MMEPTPLTIPNGTRIHSAVLPQNTFRTDKPTYRLEVVRNVSAYARLIQSDALTTPECGDSRVAIMSSSEVGINKRQRQFDTPGAFDC